MLSLRRLCALACHNRNIIKPERAPPRRRQFATTSVRKFGPSPDPPSVALAVGLALGLPLALWTYKVIFPNTVTEVSSPADVTFQCLCLVLLQRKLIYMGYVPPGAREEDLTAYRDLLRGIELEEIQLRNIEHTCTLHGIVVRNSETLTQRPRRPRVILIYLQGNAGNPLHRIPMFKALLHACSNLELTIVAVAPRSFWRSTRRAPTEDGLLSDYRQVVEYAHTRWPTEPVFLLGHSLGASVGACLTSRMSDADQNVRGLILENPFSSIPDMVRALYPSRWLPYHYLGSFAWDRWDAVRATSEAPSTSLLGRLLRENGLLILQSEKDEVVPLSMGRDISDAGNARSPFIIRGALHENAWESREWGIAIRTFLQDMLK